MQECVPRMRVHAALGSRATNPSPSRRVADASHGCVFCLFVLPQACAQDPTYAGYAQYSTYLGYSWLADTASKCGHPASTVKATHPPVWTCDGAFLHYRKLYPDGAEGACAKTSVSKVDENGQTYDDYDHSPASCDTAECAATISDMTDQTMVCWKKGFQVSILTALHVRASEQQAAAASLCGGLTLTTTTRQSPRPKTTCSTSSLLQTWPLISPTEA